MKLSIITINYNNAEGLRKTMESVFVQTCRDFEYIVVDGSSTDGSIDVIRTSALQAEGLDFKWISEPDTGIYNAMNKGLKMAHGEYTLMLNSGDFLVDEYVIERIVPELYTEDIVQGNLIQEYPNRTIRFRGYGRSNISFLDVLEAQFPHQAMFIKLSAMEEYGYYDESYKKGSDTYFFITSLGLGNATYRYVDLDITNFDVNGISSMKDAKWRMIDKEEDARWYGIHVSYRLQALCESAKKSEKLYAALHQHKFIWFLAMGLAKLSEWITPPTTNVKTEKIN